MLEISFFKYHGRGNDFILIDDRNKSCSLSKENISFLCDRNLGIGADGLVLIQDSEAFDFKMRIFNSDGMEANSCGNALFCFGKFVQDHKLTNKNKITVQLKRSTAAIHLNVDHLILTLNQPKLIASPINIIMGDKHLFFDWIDSGVDHAVTFLDEINDIDIEMIGRKVRHHQKFHPNGVNANFANLVEKDVFFVRTYERGVEKETLSCITGAIATAFSGKRKYKIDGPITIKNQIGEVEISFDDNKKAVNVRGGAVFIFKGKIQVTS